MRAHPSGFTLVEVLATLVLLAMIVAAMLPLLARAERIVLEPAPSDLAPLGLLADRVMEDPAPLGLEEDMFEGFVSWPDQPGIEPVRVHTVRAPGDGGSDHVWVLFEWKDQIVARWHEKGGHGGDEE